MGNDRAASLFMNLPRPLEETEEFGHAGDDVSVMNDVEGVRDAGIVVPCELVIADVRTAEGCHLSNHMR